MPELTITSPYVHRVDSQLIYHGQPYARADFIPKVRDFGFGLRLRYALPVVKIIGYIDFAVISGNGMKFPIQKSRVSDPDPYPDPDPHGSALI